MTSKPKTGRPLAKISEADVEELTLEGCTNTDIADTFGVDEGTIRKRFSGLLRKTRARLRKNLRAKQIELAMNGDRTMLIWLGKQMLKQHDTTNIHSVNENKTEFKGAVIAAPNYSDAEKKVYEKYRRQAMGDN